MLKFVPRGPLDRPILTVEAKGEGFVFQAIDTKGEVQIEVYCANFSDALTQVANSIRIYGNGTTEYDVDSSLVRAKALEDAASYLKERAERLKQQQRKDFSGERDRNINALGMWARQVQRL